MIVLLLFSTIHTVVPGLIPKRGSYVLVIGMIFDYFTPSVRWTASSIVTDVRRLTHYATPI